MSTALFHEKLTLLNRNFIQFLSQKVCEFPAADLSPSVKGYLKHVTDLDKMYAVSDVDLLKPVQLSNGKSDRAALPTTELAHNFCANDKYIPPCTETSKSTTLSFGKSGSRKRTAVDSIGDYDSARRSVAENQNTTKDNTRLSCLLEKSDGIVNGGKQVENSSQFSVTPTIANLFSSNTSQLKTVPQINFPSNSSAIINTTNHLSSDEHKSEEGENEDVVPKVEIVEQKEPDALFSMKTVVYSLNNNEWSKMGIGFVNVKPAGDSKHLLVRAATTLGTIWINTVVNEHLKATRLNEKSLKIRFPTTSNGSVIFVTFLLKNGSPMEYDKLSQILKT